MVMLLKLLTIASLALCIAAHSPNITRVIPGFVPTRPNEPHWKASAEYLTKRKHDIEHRDHGCVELEHSETHKEYQCVNIWLKNKFSEGNIAPSNVFLDYQHPNDDKEYAYKPTVTWVENVNPWRIRGCVAAPGGHNNTLEHGKLRWFAVYDMAQNTNQQSGSIDGTAFTGNRMCSVITFPQAFAATPHLKFQIKLKYGLMTSQNALLVWGKAISNTQVTYCVEEFYGWSGYHHEYEVHWYGIVNPETEDDYSEKLQVTFSANQEFPADHNNLNSFYCQNVTLSKWHFPCPSVMVQAFEPTEVCPTALVAWVAFLKDDQMTVCYADKRGIMGRRKVAVHAHVIIYGAQDKCQSTTCGDYQECIHPTWNTAQCGCHTHCHNKEDKVCGTNMVNYMNRCELEKAICESGNKFQYAHHGVCEEYTVGHGKALLKAETGKDCDGLYCAVVSTGNRIWYQHAKINVQTSVNWNNKIDGSDASTHDATASWIEDVTPNSFKACIMEAGRSTKAQAPHINWFAYQGKLDKVSTETIEVGDWQSGTHCVPLHVRTLKEKPFEHKPPGCPRTDLDDHKTMSSEEEKWHYDSGMMSKIYGQHQHEWFQRMVKGYGVKKMKLTNGMHLNGATIMLTVEQSEKDSVVKAHDAVNVWMEHDATSAETYVCLREMQNWDGKHKGIHVHWTLFMDRQQTKDLIFKKMESNNPSAMPSAMPSVTPKPAMAHQHMPGNDHSLIQTLVFKPSMEAPEESNYAFCQAKRYLPANFSDNHDSTVLVSIDHQIPAFAAFESMKKYHLHSVEMAKGIPMGDLMFNKEEDQPSWMMPHMWRANLTGWRPHMRIYKNSDYSAWVEGMNKTHIRVCQKSVSNGYSYDGVKVNMVVFPERCPSGYVAFRNDCFKMSDLCGVFDGAIQQCSQMGAKLATPEDARENVFVSYLANQEQIFVGKTDRDNEGVWKRVDSTSSSTYNRWAASEPKVNGEDCALQSGRQADFTERADSCNTCVKYVCEKAAPQLSCHFPNDNYCMNGGECSYGATGPAKLSCVCVPPYTGPRCETKQ